MRRVLFVIALAALLALGLSVEGLGPAGALAARPSAGRITHVGGQVEVRRIGEVGARTARRWMRLFTNDVVETASDGRVRILLSDSSVLTLSANSKIRIDEQVYNPRRRERRSIFNLFRGKVRAVVSKYLNAAQSKFEIRTPTAVAGVRGTIFVQTFNPATGESATYVFEGSVHLTNLATGQALIVDGNQFALFAPGVNVTLQEIDDQTAEQQDQDFQVGGDEGTGGANDEDLPTDSYDESSEHVDQPDELEEESGGDETQTAQNDQGENPDEQAGEEEAQGEDEGGEVAAADEEGGGDEVAAAGDEGAPPTDEETSTEETGGEDTTLASGDGTQAGEGDTGGEDTTLASGDGTQGSDSGATSDSGGTGEPVAGTGDTGGGLDTGSTGFDDTTGGGDLSLTGDTGTLPIDLEPPPPFSSANIRVRLRP